MLDPATMHVDVEVRSITPELTGTAPAVAATQTDNKQPTSSVIETAF
jgi:hypothetical protein